MRKIFLIAIIWTKIAYGLTSRGNVKEKLEYVFNLYDIDGNGYIEKDEIKPVLLGMYTLLGNKMQLWHKQFTWLNIKFF